LKQNALRQIVLLAIALLLLGQAPAHPEISSISPQAAVAGKTVTLTGRQFTADNTILFGSTIIRHVGISSAIGITCTNDPACRSGIIQTLTFVTPMTAMPGPHSVSVRNANGTSNAVTFTVSK
jgi:hypothetical protein